MDQTTPNNVMPQQTVPIQGPPTPQAPTPTPNTMSEKDHTLRLIAFIFAILGIVPAGFMCMAIAAFFSGALLEGAAGAITPIFLLLPLAWTIPLTIHTYKVYKGTSENTTIFGILVLIFLSLISGILLLCSKKDR